VLKYFDEELNEVLCGHSPATPLIDTANDSSSENTPKRWHVIGSSEMGDNAQLTSCRENESSRDMNVNCQTSLHSCDAKQCYFDAESWRQPEQETRSVTSVADERETDTAVIDDDVSWFFEDTSDAGICREQQTPNGASHFFHSVNTFANNSQNRLVSVDKLHKTVPPLEMVPFQKGVNGYAMPAMNALDIHDENDWSDMLQSQMLNDSQEFFRCSSSNSNNCSSVVSLSERHMRSIGNAVEPGSSSQSLLETDRESDEKSTGTPPQTDLFAVPPEFKSVIPSLITDHKSLHKRSSDNVCSSRTLRGSRILLHSRHFASVKNAACNLTAISDELSDVITTDDTHDRQSSVLLSKLSQESSINQAVADEKQFSTIGMSQQTTDFAANSTSEKNAAREPAYFDRLRMIGTGLSHADDELMQLAIKICHKQLAPNPAQTWFVL